MEGRASSNEGRGRKGLWRPILLLAVVITIFVLARVFDVGDKLWIVRDWIQSLGVWGPIVFVLLYIVAVVAVLPGSAITLTGGALFGSALGIVLVSIASTLGASLAFLIARYFARSSVAGWLGTKKKFRELDELTEKHGAIIVAITRLVPIFPFNILNYGFGLTKVRFWTYVFWSWLCMLPGTILYVVGADAVIKAVAKGEIPWLLVAIVVVVAIILFLLVRQARKKLRENG
jgi:uncharacterized membrane protein YdjX (TVP38/TMEM64 family)